MFKYAALKLLSNAIAEFLQVLSWAVYIYVSPPYLHLSHAKVSSQFCCGIT